jgi:hypothetical protein
MSLMPIPEKDVNVQKNCSVLLFLLQLNISVLDPRFRNSYRDPEFVNVYGTQESIPVNRFRQPMQPSGIDSLESIPGLL